MEANSVSPGPQACHSVCGSMSEMTVILVLYGSPCPTMLSVQHTCCPFAFVESHW